MSVAMNTTHQELVRTPPHIPRHAFAHLPPIDYLISSPLTPPARRPHLPFFSLDDHEHNALTHMLRSASRHRKGDATLVANMHSIGNASYIPKRPIIINWLVDVCASFKFEPATLHLAVRHMDWFMSARLLEQRNWQLCAVTALFIAAKCEEAGRNVPITDDLAYLCENIYPSASLLWMEVVILSCLRWDLVAKTPVHFLTFFLTAVRQRFVGSANLRVAEAHLKPSRARAPVAPTGKDAQLEGFLSDDDSDDESYTSDMHDCECRAECRCAEEDEDDEALECDEEMLFENSSEVVRDEGVETDAMGELQRVALCILELSLYDLDIMTEFPSNVIAATALSIAVEITGVEGVAQMDVGTVTCLSEKNMAPCRRVLFEHFRNAQTA